jgi:hypothetical protein
MAAQLGIVFSYPLQVAYGLLKGVLCMCMFCLARIRAVFQVIRRHGWTKGLSLDSCEGNGLNWNASDLIAVFTVQM